MNNYNKKTVAEKKHALVESKSFILFVGLLFFGAPVFSHNPDIQNCVSITDPAARLICYDVLFQDTQKIDKSEKGLGLSSSRFAMLLENGVVKKLQEEIDTASCEISAAENFLKEI